MKICIVSGIFPPDIGGPASYVPKIAGELQKLGNSTVVICLSDSLKDNDALNYPFPVIRISRKLFKPWRIIRTIFNICRVLKDSDLLYVNGLSFESMLAAWIMNIPTVHKVVGDYAWERAQLKKLFQGNLDEYQVAKKGILLKLLDWVRTTPLKRTEKVIVPSFYLQQVVQGWGIPSDKVEVIYNAIEVKEAELPMKLPPFSGKTIITVGRLVPWKGIDRIIEILIYFPSFRLVIIGDGPQKSQLENLAQMLNLSNRVLFLGSLPKEQVFACLKQANVFILNSSYEGLPHVILEAMSAELPIVATDAGGTSEVVEDKKTGILIPIGDKKALILAIEQIFNSPELAQILVLNSKQFLQSRFTASNMVAQVKNVLYSIKDKSKSSLVFKH